MDPYVYLGGFIGILGFFFVIAWAAEKDRLWPIALMLALGAAAWYAYEELGWRL